MLFYRLGVTFWVLNYILYFYYQFPTILLPLLTIDLNYVLPY